MSSIVYIVGAVVIIGFVLKMVGVYQGAVRAEKGVVILTGKAPSLATSVRASEVVGWVSGVRAVRNELAW